MNALKIIKRGILQGFGFVLVVGISGFTYAAISTVTDGDSLTADIWNAIVNNVNQNTVKLTAIESNGTNVGIGVANPSSKLDVDGDINLSGKLVQEDWIEISSFSNSWTNYGSPWNTAGYYKDKNGEVRLKGLVKSGTIGAYVFVLPEGYRPTNNLHKAASTQGDSLCIVRIYPDGGIEPGNACVNSWVSLEDINFRVN